LQANFLRGKAVYCDLTGEKTYDRYVGVCYTDSKDIGAAVIAAGHALDCCRYSGGRFTCNLLSKVTHNLHALREMIIE
jgi:endonuclease YncB( thermonuclease family)